MKAWRGLAAATVGFIGIGGLVELPAWAFGDGVEPSAAAVAPMAGRALDPSQERGWLGVLVTPVPDDARERFEIPEGVGVQIERAEEGSPASKAKLRGGDILLQIDSEEIQGVEGLVSMIQSKKAGESIKLWYLREGRKRTATVTLGSAADRGNLEESRREAEAHSEAVKEREKAEKAERAAAKERQKAEKAEKEAQKAREKLAETLRAGEAETPKPSGSGFLGVVPEALTQERRSELGLDDDNGVAISSTIPGSAAEAAGLKAGDVLLAIAGKKVGDPGEVVKVIGSMQAGDEIKLSILRDGEKKSVRATLGARPSGEDFMEVPSPGTPPATPRRAPEARRTPQPTEEPSGAEGDAERAPQPAWLGVELQPVEIGGDLREVLGIEEGEGVKIGRVVDDSPAAAAGLQRNDLILKINGKKVGSAQAVGELISQAHPGQAVNVDLLRKGSRERVKVTLGSRTR